MKIVLRLKTNNDTILYVEITKEVNGLYREKSGFIRDNQHFYRRNDLIKEDDIREDIYTFIKSGFKMKYINNPDKMMINFYDNFYNMIKISKMMGLNLVIKRREKSTSIELVDNEKNGRLINKKEIFFLENERRELVDKINEEFEYLEREDEGQIKYYFMRKEGDISYKINLEKNEHGEEVLNISFPKVNEEEYEFNSIVEISSFEDINIKNEILFI